MWIPAKILKVAASELSLSLATTFNLSMSSGQVSSDGSRLRSLLFIRRVTLANPSNYRPMSVLSICTKIFEKIVHLQLYQHLYKNNIFKDTVLIQTGIHLKVNISQILGHSIRQSLLLPMFLNTFMTTWVKSCWLVLCFLDLKKGLRHGWCWVVDDKSECCRYRWQAINSLWFTKYINGRTHSACTWVSNVSNEQSLCVLSVECLNGLFQACCFLHYI